MVKAKRPQSSAPADVVASCTRETGDGQVRIVLIAKPKSVKEGLEASADGALVLKVSAPPVEGAANARIREVLAHLLGVSKSAVSITRGETARQKELSVRGLTLAAVCERLSVP